jgi:hypothetical protein
MRRVSNNLLARSFSGVKVVITNKLGKKEVIEGTPGQSVLEAFWDKELEYLEGACDHAMAWYPDQFVFFVFFLCFSLLTRPL